MALPPLQALQAGASPSTTPEIESAPAVGLETSSAPAVRSEAKEVRLCNLASRLPKTSAASSASGIVTIPSFSGWFSFDEIHEIERRNVPEFFGGKSVTRGPKTYKYIRDTIIQRFRANPSNKIKFSEVRRILVSDAVSIQRIFDFLTVWGLINYMPSSKSSTKEKKKVAETIEKIGDRKILCSNCREACSLVCFTSDKAQSKIILCQRCFVPGNYRPILSLTDFKRVEISEDFKLENSEEMQTDWTDEETLRLLEAIYHYSDDWRIVALYLGTRTVEECIAKFIRLPFGEQFIGPPVEEYDKMDAKRKCLTPLDDYSHPIIAQAAFLYAIVGSNVARAAAQSAISALNGEKHDEDEPAAYEQSITSEAKLQLAKEQEDIERCITNIVETEMKEIQEKIKHFEEIELQMEKEWQQLRCMKDLFFADQLGFIQHIARAKTVKKKDK